jgi:hypothetical protein
LNSLTARGMENLLSLSFGPQRRGKKIAALVRILAVGVAYLATVS